MEGLQLQQLLFQQIKNTIQPQLSMVNEVADVLKISNDSAYRRIRGEKQLTFEELKLLATYFKISVDQILHLQSDAFVFNGKITNNSDYNFDNWQQSVLQNLKMIASYRSNQYYYLAKEIPFLYYYLIPEIAAFKSYFFLKSVLHHDEWKTKKFSLNSDNTKYTNIWNNISKCYSSIPSTEIWGVENISTTIHQIQFYTTTGYLSKNDALILLDKMDELITHIELQAEYGVKLNYQQKPHSSLPKFKMFINDLIMGDNMQLIQLDDTQITYINHSIMNFIYTKDTNFNTYMKQTIDSIAQKSIQISDCNEKDRIVFFNKIRQKINISKDHINL